MRLTTTDDVYLRVLSDIEFHGVHKEDRTGTGTTSRFGTQGRFCLKNGEIPLLTLRKVMTRSIIHELLWFISGSTDIEYLKKNNVSIWDSWVIPETARYNEEGKLIGGSIGTGAYGSQWRNRENTIRVPVNEADEPYLEKGFKLLGTLGEEKIFTRTIDQLQNAIDRLKKDPDSRRILVTTFNPDKEDFCALPPCHSYFQFWSRELSVEERVTQYINSENRDHIADLTSKNTDPDVKVRILDEAGIPTRALSCQLYMRSNDVLVGGVFNIAQYGILTHMVAHLTGMVAEEFIWTVGDAHIYDNQSEGLEELLTREPINRTPYLKFKRKVENIDDFTFDDFEIVNYEHREPINFPVAI